MAVVVRIFDELTEAIEQGQKSARQDPAGGLVAGSEAYVAFGLEHPARYSMLFSRQRPATPDYPKPVPIGPDGGPVLEYGAETFALLVQAIEDCVNGRRLREHRRPRRLPPPCGSPCTDRQPAHRATALPVARPGRIRPPARAVAGPGDRLSI